MPELEIDETLRLTQLLCTRLCHDLAGPVGAVAAGVELASDDPSQIDEETLSLIGSSSAAASRKLKFLRAALGLPSTASGPQPRIDDLLDGYLEAVSATKPAVLWLSADDMKAFNDTIGPTSSALLLNLCLMVLEGLPVCRVLECSVARTPSIGVVVRGEGDPNRTAAWRLDILEAVTTGVVPNLTAKTIQPYMTRRLAEAVEGRVKLCADGNVLCAEFGH